MMRKALAVLLLIAAAACYGPEPFEGRPFGFEFETDRELDFIHWECGELFERTEEFATHGRYGLRLQLFQGDSIGLKFYHFVRDWRAFQRLRFDLFNASARPVELHFRVEDREDPDPSEIFWSQTSVPPGTSSVVLDLDRLRCSRGRQLDRARVEMLHIFLVRPQRGTVLYFDRLRLE